MSHNNLCNPQYMFPDLWKKMRISFSIRGPWRSGTLNNRWYYSHYLREKNKNKNAEIRWFLCKVTESIHTFLTWSWDSESCTFPCWDPQWVYVFLTSDQRLCLCPFLVFHMDNVLLDPRIWPHLINRVQGSRKSKVFESRQKCIQISVPGSTYVVKLHYAGVKTSPKS